MSNNILCALYMYDYRLYNVYRTLCIVPTFADCFGRSFRVEWRVSGQHYVHENAETPHVAALVVRVRPHLHRLGFVVSYVLLRLEYLRGRFHTLGIRYSLCNRDATGEEYHVIAWVNMYTFAVFYSEKVGAVCRSFKLTVAERKRNKDG